jgi:hypothetical protein
MFPIAMATVTNTSTPTITFNSIPQTYKHLELRMSYNNLTGLDNMKMVLNGTTGPSWWHLLYGDGSTASGSNSDVNASGIFGIQFGRSDTSQYAGVVSIPNYTNTTNKKTVRYLGGHDMNGSGGTWMTSNYFNTSAAITSIALSFVSYNFAPGTVISLYGIKG